MLPTEGISARKVPADQVDRISQLFKEPSKQSDLKCQIHYWGPSLGFDLTYTAGFVILPNNGQLSLNENVDAYIRVTPSGRAPVFLTMSYQIPATSPRVAENERFNFFFPGDFTVGEGKYDVTLLVVDEDGRKYRTQWKLKTSGHVAASPLSPLTVSTIQLATWNGDLDTAGLRLTIFLDATETSPTAVRVRPGTSAYLLSTLSSILREIRCRSVRVVAFNLDEEREIFRADRFDSADFAKLAQALRDFRSATIPSQSLKSSAWRDYLWGLAQGELVKTEPPDAVVFVGAPSHFTDNRPLAMQNPSNGKALFFDFEYMRVIPVFAAGSDTYRGDYKIVPDDEGATSSPQAIRPFPDAVDRLTRELHGTVFQITSPKDLALAIQKMSAELHSKH